MIVGDVGVLVGPTVGTGHQLQYATPNMHASGHNSPEEQNWQPLQVSPDLQTAADGGRVVG